MFATAGRRAVVLCFTVADSDALLRKKLWRFFGTFVRYNLQINDLGGPRSGEAATRDTGVGLSE